MSGARISACSRLIRDNRVLAVLLVLIAVVGVTLLIVSDQNATRSASPGTDVSGSSTIGVASSTSAFAAESTKPLIDPALTGANELGEVPVLMYHRIATIPKSNFDRTPQQFRDELENLAAENFVPITAAEYAKGDIEIPASKHPVVLTFDDGSSTDLTLGSDGRPTPDCAVGVILDVAKKHPGFRPTATFYVNRRPFNDATGATARWAVANGFELGNHTLDHAKLSRLSSAQVQREIVRLAQVVDGLVPAVKLETFALPYGIRPKTEALAKSGGWNGVTYDFVGVFLVGAGPSPSPFSTTFNAMRLPRIRSDDVGVMLGSGDWLARFAKEPRLLYTSDGDPRFISYPASMAAKLQPEWRTRGFSYPDTPSSSSPVASTTTQTPSTGGDASTPNA